MSSKKLRNCWFWPFFISTAVLVLMSFLLIGNKVAKLGFLPVLDLVWFWLVALIVTIFGFLWYTHEPKEKPKKGRRIEPILCSLLGSLTPTHRFFIFGVLLIGEGIISGSMIFSSPVGPIGHDIGIFGIGPIVVGMSILITLGGLKNHRINLRVKNIYEFGIKQLSRKVYPPLY